MAEYIDREAAFDAITDLAGKAPTRSAYEAVWKSARALKKIPAANVAPVAPGKWGDNGITGSMLVKCSVCGFDCGANSFSYCPKCGARMRQAKRGEDSEEV